AAMLGQVELPSAVAEDIVDEPRREVEEELAADRGQGALDAHPVVEEAFQDEGTDTVIILGLGVDIVRGVAEDGAAGTVRLVLTVGDLKEGDGLVGDGADRAGAGPFAGAVSAAARAGGFLGCTADGYKLGSGCFRAHACVLGSEDWWTNLHYTGCK